MISLTINGQTFEVKEGSTVLQAAAEIGINIPTLCYHKDLSPLGGCRFCVVEVQGSRLPMTSCVLPVSPGMVVQTDTPNITRHRRAILRMLLSNFYDGGYKDHKGTYELDQANELAHWARVYDIDMREVMAKRPHHPIDSDPNPFVWVDRNKCIQCMRCVRACGEIQGRFVWSQSYRGYQASIVAGSDGTMLASRCESCGACVVYCPTGALDNKMSIHAGIPDRLVRTTCAYCGVGCQLDLNVRDDVPGGRVIRVTSCAYLDGSTVNGKHLCVKGRYGYEFIHNHRRLTRPRVRKYLLEGAERSAGWGPFVDVDWETALDLAAHGLRRARDEFGSDSIAVLASGKCLNEENYLLNKLARQVIGTHNIYCGADLGSNDGVEGLLQTAGLPAMSNSFDDISSQARALFVIGSNLTEQHPVFGAHIRQAVLRRKVKLVVAHPDFVNIAEYAALALHYKPGTEAALVNGILNILLEKGWHDPASIERPPMGFSEARAMIDLYTPQRVAEITGLAVEGLYQAAHILGTYHPAAVLWSEDFADPEAGRQAVYALVNLQFLLGNLDTPGGGLNPLRSQNNSQGAYDMGCLPDMLPGYQPAIDPDVRRKFEHAWGRVLPVRTGLRAVDLFLPAENGNLKALYIVDEELIDGSSRAVQVRQGLEACDFVVLQTSAASETARYADVVLPGVTFAEKTGTFTNSERRIQMVKQAIDPVGEARPDWQIIASLAERILGNSTERPVEADFARWAYQGTDEIMDEIAALTPIYWGVSHARLAEDERVQWPVEESGTSGTPLLKAGTFSGGVVRWVAASTPLFD